MQLTLVNPKSLGNSHGKSREMLGYKSGLHRPISNFKSGLCSLLLQAGIFVVFVARFAWSFVKHGSQLHEPISNSKSKGAHDLPAI
jgi:hypothetical protein